MIQHLDLHHLLGHHSLQQVVVEVVDLNPQEINQELLVVLVVVDVVVVM
jgi:hypothetical protein